MISSSFDTDVFNGLSQSETVVIDYQFHLIEEHFILRRRLSAISKKVKYKSYGYEND